MAEVLTPLLIDSAEAARLLGVGKSLLYQMASSGQLGPVPVEFNSKKLYSVEELQGWVRSKCPPREKWIEILKGKDGNGNLKRCVN